MKRMGRKNLTLVAFYGPKPDPFVQLVDTLQTTLHSKLGTAFSAYMRQQVHATIVGLEGWRAGVEVFNSNRAPASSKHSAMDLRGLFDFMQQMPPLKIRIGGFDALGIYPFTSRGLHPYIRSFAFRDAQAVIMGWPVAAASFPLTLDLMRRECRRYNVFHKHHRLKDDIDNDFYLVLGQVDRNAVSEEKVEYVQKILRQLLADRTPLDLLMRPEDLSVVAYSDTQLPIAGSVRYSLAEAQTKIEELMLLYEERATVQIRDE
jgi:hypothetical protein